MQRRKLAKGKHDVRFVQQFRSLTNGYHRSSSPVSVVSASVRTNTPGHVTVQLYGSWSGIERWEYHVVRLTIEMISCDKGRYSGVSIRLLIREITAGTGHSEPARNRLVSRLEPDWGLLGTSWGRFRLRSVLLCTGRRGWPPPGSAWRPSPSGGNPPSSSRPAAAAAAAETTNEPVNIPIL